MTKTGAVLGTAAYLSPEQARGERAGPASDIYALAVLAWELLTGERPFKADTAAAEAVAHVHAEVPSISARRPGLPVGLDSVFHRALAKRPDERHASATEFVEALRGALDQSAGATTVAFPRAVPRAPRGRERPVLLVPVIAALALLGLGVVLAALVAAKGDAEEAAPSSVTTVVVTEEGRTERVTVTAAAAAPPPDASAGQLSLAQARALQDQSTAALRNGAWEQALALARRALERLRGNDRTYEGYANYNIGRALVELGRCEQAMPHLERREELLGPHPDVTAARERCED